jgi:periplasmic divalent cation tolerance protein
MAEIVLAFSTVPADFDAAALAHDLVAIGAAACVTILPGVQSVYTWQGAIESAREQQLLIKTTSAAVDALWNALKAGHPYDVPEFVVVPASGGNERYLDWIRESVRT